ncbi:MAG TPA: DUF1641 domain-containing protein [Ilumatobacter sp.]|nr:DUF1641 domain-containing protein [Ilumatobacter sp.]
MTETSSSTVVPVDAVVERLNDPAVAASLVTLLDNAELLSTLVLGLSGLLSRGDSIMDMVAESVGDLKAARANTELPSLPSVSELTTLVGQVSAATPTLQALLASPAAQPATIEFLGRLSAAATTGAERARANNTHGPASLMGIRKVLKDDDIQVGLGLLLEIAKALGQQLKAEPSAAPSA